MAKTTGKNGNGNCDKTPDAVKANPDAKASKASKATPVAIVHVNAGALSTSVGPMVVAGLAKSYHDEQKAASLMEGVKSKRYDLMAATTEAIVKAAKSDKTIDLTAAFADDKKAQERLNTQIGLALGIRAYVENDKGKPRLIYAKEVQKFFPSPKDTKGDPATVQKATLRSNFIHMLKKCAQAASAVVEMKLTMENDKTAGTLKLSGPGIVETFGAKEVLLNEKQTVPGVAGGESTQLKAKPSFTKLADMAAAAHGKERKRRIQTTGTATPVDADTAMESLCSSLVSAISKAETPLSSRMQKALESARSAIDKALD